MPAWCQFYGQPPREFWELTNDEYNAMEAYRQEYMKALRH